MLVALLAAHDSDKVASACSEWSAHCVATHKSDVWRQRRDERRGGVKPKAAATKPDNSQWSEPGDF